MELKYNLIEGNDAASRAILMMKYDLTKTLTENIILEQSVLTDYMIRHYMSRFYDWLKTFDTHDWMTVIEVSSTIAATFSGPFAPIFWVIGGAAAAYDSYLYFKEDDPYMGTIMLGLTLIGGSMLKGIFKSSKVFRKRGVQGVVELIKKSKSGAKMTKEQLKDLATFGIEFAKKSSQVKDAMTKEVSKRLLTGLAKKSPKFLVNLILALNKIGVIKLSEIVLTVGGTIYTFDKLYLYVFRDSIFANKEYLNSRTKNDQRYWINSLLKYDKEVKEYLVLTVTNATETAVKKGVSLANVNADESYKNEIKLSNKEVKSKKQSKLNPPKFLVSPTLDDVLLREKVIKKGQKGDSIIEIQKMLYSIGYNDYISKGGTLSKWDDGIYGDSTELAVMAFQEHENLEVNGIVSVDTLKKIIEKYKENSNE
jgi:peptidoglycan hydrolase-like protein with peptidoglycan-binding domain